MEVTPEYKIALTRELRQRQTQSEARLWEFLRAHRLDNLGFRRQRPMGRYLADFCCEQLRLVVEVDGGYHDQPEQRALDIEREAHFTGRGYTVLRVSANDVMTNIPNVLLYIQTAATKIKSMREAEADHAPGTPLPSAGEGKGEGATCAS